MNPKEKLIKFKIQLLDLTADAGNGGVPLQNIILELEQEKFKLQYLDLARQIQRDADEMSKKIVTAGFTMQQIDGCNKKN